MAKKWRPQFWRIAGTLSSVTKDNSVRIIWIKIARQFDWYDFRTFHWKSIAHRDQKTRMSDQCSVSNSIQQFSTRKCLSNTETDKREHFMDCPTLHFQSLLKENFSSVHAVTSRVPTFSWKYVCTTIIQSVILAYNVRTCKAPATAQGNVLLVKWRWNSRSFPSFIIFRAGIANGMATYPVEYIGYSCDFLGVLGS